MSDRYTTLIVAIVAMVALALGNAARGCATATQESWHGEGPGDAVMGWAGSLEEAEDLATHGLGGECRITSCTGREYRRSRGISERGRVAA